LLAPGSSVTWNGVQYFQNPFTYPVSGSPGDAAFNAVDIKTGQLLWQVAYGDNRTDATGGWNGTAFTTGYSGLDGTYSCAADGKIYVVEEPSRHASSWVSSANQAAGVTVPSIDFLWRPGYVYCFGAGPTQFSSLTTDKVQVNAGSSITISGSVKDLSPYKPGVAAVGLPVSLTYIGSDGVSHDIITVYTDAHGQFTYTWVPWVKGTLTIAASSAGNGNYEAPDNIYWPIYVQSAQTMVPVLEGIIVILVVVAVAVPISVYIASKPKSKPTQESKP